MNLTKQTNRFALIFFCFFIIVELVGVAISRIFNTSLITLQIISQIIYFSLPVVGYLIYTRQSPKEVLKLKPIGIGNLIIVIIFGFVIQPLIGLISYTTSVFFPNAAEESLKMLSDYGMLKTLIVVALVPPIIEELAFRGVFLSGYKNLGWKKACLCSALLFGLLHLNFQQSPYAFFVGIFFCFLVDRCDSILASIIPHAIINATSIISAFRYDQSEIVQVSGFDMTTFLSVSFLAALSLPFVTLLMFLILKINQKKVYSNLPNPEIIEENINWDTKIKKEKFLTASIWAIIVIFIILSYSLLYWSTTLTN